MELKPTIIEAACGESREEGREGGEFYRQAAVKALASAKCQIFSGCMRTPPGCSRKLHL